MARPRPGMPVHPLTGTYTAYGSFMDTCSAFADRLAAEYGIHVSPTDLVADGQRHRITPDGDRRGSKALVYILHDDDRPVGWFEYHKTGDKGSIKLGDHKPRTPAELAEARKRWAEERARQESELAQQYADRAADCATLWESAGPADGHPYLTRKGITAPTTVRRLASIPAGGITSEAMTDVLLLPLFSIGDRKIASIQAITPNGDKRFAANARTAGTYHAIKGTDPSRVLVCEGYATGYALAQVTGHSVVCAMSANRLEEIARWVAQQGREVVICADNDHGTQARRGFNPGIDAGRAAANAIGARCIWPIFDAHDDAGTDWDDWLREGGDHDRLLRLVRGEEVQPASEEGDRQPRGENPSDALAGTAAVVESTAIQGEVVDLPRKGGGTAYTQLTSWASLDLVLSDKGTPVANMDNAARLLERHPEMQSRFWFDEFQGRVFSTWNSTGQEAEWSDSDDVRLALWMQRTMGIGRMAVGTARDAVTAVAMAHRRNEVHDWLRALDWDGVARLSSMLPKAFGTPDTPYTAAVGRCWLISMVARALDPGCKVDTMPVFEGDQGLRKSTAMQTLVGARWFAEAAESPTSKDFYQVLTGKLLVEIAELDAFSRTEVNTIKRVVTCRVDRYRAPYGRRAEDHPRSCVFAGTTNRDDWNRDDTGARRFWPVACTAVDIEWLAANRDQLFAEAVELYQAGTAWWDVPSDDAKREQEARRAGDEWEDIIYHWTLGKVEVTVGDVLQDALKVDAERWDKPTQVRVGNCLRALGWKRVTVRRGAKVLKAWIRGGGNSGNEPPF